MKKIFRMALVFAFAGAALMYTGCTKDYSEEINSLDSEISALEGKYQDLLNQLTDAKAALEAAYKAADKTLEGNFDKKIAEINAAIAKKADAAEIEAAMDQLKKDLMAEADELQKSAEALKQEVQDSLDEFYAIIAGELRSLVVIPDFYFAGVEATSFDIAEVWSNVPLKNEKDVESEDHHGAKVVFPKTAKLEWEWDKAKDKDGRTIYPNDYALSQLGKANYNMNPSAFDVDAAKSWSFNGMNVLYTKAEDEDWAPVFEGISAKDGIATALFSIKNPEYMYAQVDHTFGFDADTTDNVPVIQLVAELEDGKTIASDWEAVIPGYELIDHLAFAKANIYEKLY